ncbi:MAG: methyltransferase domain-containing protein [Planctomycetes bacterium]|nr:methyltransferase domain-containing protein [Planctomycetota bacterium]
MDVKSCPAEEAFSQLAEEAGKSTRPQDTYYLNYHRLRYLHTAQRLQELLPGGAKILDIGSHFLHQGTILSRMGFEVAGVDVPEFVGLDFVKERADNYNISNSAIKNLEEGEFLEGTTDAFDAVLFTEALEHITFNPIIFWRRVNELLHTGGLIYLTTPNAYEWRNLRKVLKRLFLGRGMGVRVPNILNRVTYGHHWKLYCGRELKEYFALLSNDFKTEVNYYSLPGSNRRGWWHLREIMQRICNLIPGFREQLEAVVYLQGRDGWLAVPPENG